MRVINNWLRVFTIFQKENNLDLNNQNIALIVGSEETGLSKEIQKKLDLIVDISMTNNMESLNASVATAIAMHEIFIKK